MTPSQDLLIVASERPDLYARLKRVLQDDPTVEVILDRRQGERRARVAVPREDRRRHVRRIDDENRRLLATLGVIRVGAGRRAPRGPATGPGSA